MEIIIGKMNKFACTLNLSYSICFIHGANRTTAYFNAFIILTDLLNLVY